MRLLSPVQMVTRTRFAGLSRLCRCGAVADAFEAIGLCAVIPCLICIDAYVVVGLCFAVYVGCGAAFPT